MLETLSERTMTECHRLTERRGHEILRGVRQPHDVVVTAIWPPSLLNAQSY